MAQLLDAIRVRIPPTLLDRIDRLEARERGRGDRTVTRSSIIRDALDAYLADIENGTRERTRATTQSAATTRQ